MSHFSRLFFFSLARRGRSASKFEKSFAAIAYVAKRTVVCYKNTQQLNTIRQHPFIITSSTSDNDDGSNSNQQHPTIMLGLQGTPRSAGVRHPLGAQPARVLRLHLLLLFHPRRPGLRVLRVRQRHQWQGLREGGRGGEGRGGGGVEAMPGKGAAGRQPLFSAPSACIADLALVCPCVQSTCFVCQQTGCNLQCVGGAAAQDSCVCRLGMRAPAPCFYGKLCRQA